MWLIYSLDDWQQIKTEEPPTASLLLKELQIWEYNMVLQNASVNNNKPPLADTQYHTGAALS